VTVWKKFRALKERINCTSEKLRTPAAAGRWNYDYAGPWSKYTGFVAPLFSSRPSGSIEASIASYKARGVPERKLLMGRSMAIAGRRFQA
jgi:hypothetical protein